ncbi:MAG: OmpA family protein [Lentisphaerae bacterium]|nr:OmpA family protein [Lentisphaerota bacterium]
MRKKYKSIRFVLAILAIAVIATGCRSKQGQTEGPAYGYDGSISPMDVGGEWGIYEDEFPMDAGWHAESLTRVTDAQGIYPVYFAYDAYTIHENEMHNIRIVAEFLRVNPAIVLVIEGHCDERGTHEYNISLGEYRALSVREQLIMKGVESARIQTASFGKERPAEHGHNEIAWAKNRRAEFAFYRK